MAALASIPLAFRPSGRGIRVVSTGATAWLRVMPSVATLPLIAVCPALCGTPDDSCMAYRCKKLAEFALP